MTGWFIRPDMFISDRGEVYVAKNDESPYLEDLGKVNWEKVYKLAEPISQGFGKWLENRGVRAVDFSPAMYGPQSPQGPQFRAITPFGGAGLEIDPTLIWIGLGALVLILILQRRGGR
jgi:hypothetical protein